VARVRASLTKSVITGRSAGLFSLYISARALYISTKTVLYLFFLTSSLESFLKSILMHLKFAEVKAFLIFSCFSTHYSIVIFGSF
jgi:hypothetical protein